MFTNFIQLLLLIFMVYVCIHTIVNRICCCIEQVAIAKAFTRFNELQKKSFKEFEQNLKEFHMDDGK